MKKAVSYSDLVAVLDERQRSFTKDTSGNQEVYKLLQYVKRTTPTWFRPYEVKGWTDIVPNKETMDPIIAVKKKRLIDNSKTEIQDIKGLIHFIEAYPLDKEKEYTISMDGLHAIYPCLQELDAMIGMKQLKETVLDQLLFFIQDLHKHTSDKKESLDFMHTVIYGPPGTGKTEIAKLMGQLYSKLGILKKGTFRKVTRSDLIAGYLGQTAIKTRDVIQDCLGGVLFIDEAYALGCNDKRDSFSKECIDTLCEALSNYKEELMVIIAGYEDELKVGFFNQNPGLESRFTWRFKTDDYTAEELYRIFLKKVNECGWKIDPGCNLTSKWFETHMKYFSFFGRDMENLLAKIKIVHGRRVFCKPTKDKKLLTMVDIEKGCQSYLASDAIKNRKESNRSYLDNTMYV